jgi:hypothetical protein
MVDALKTLGVELIESRRSSGQGITGIRLKKGDEEPCKNWHTR